MTVTIMVSEFGEGIAWGMNPIGLSSIMVREGPLPTEFPNFYFEAEGGVLRGNINLILLFIIIGKWIVIWAIIKLSYSFISMINFALGYSQESWVSDISFDHTCWTDAARSFLAGRSYLSITPNWSLLSPFNSWVALRV